MIDPDEVGAPTFRPSQVAPGYTVDRWIPFGVISACVRSCLLTPCVRRVCLFSNPRGFLWQDQPFYVRRLTCV